MIRQSILLAALSAALFACGADDGEMKSTDMLDEDTLVEDTMDDMEMMSEDIMDDSMVGTPTTFLIRYENVATVYPFLKSGVFAIPVGDSEPGPALPGKAYEVEFTAGPVSRLSFVSMFGQSNDLFYAPGPEGIAL